MADKSDAPTTPSEKTVAAGGGSKLMVAFTGLNSLLLMGVLAMTLLRPGAGAAKHSKGEATGEAGSAEAAHDAPGEPASANGADGAHGAAGGAAAATAPRPGPMLPLPDFVVHLRDPDTDRYARLTLNVELRGESDKETLNAHLPQIRDAFLAYLSDRTVDELRGSEGMGLVKQDLTKKLQEIVPTAPVKALYVTDIVVQ